MDVEKYKKAIHSITRWDTTDEVFGFIDEGKFQNDYIYEFYCAMKILNDLIPNHSIQVIQGPNGIDFPK